MKSLFAVFILVFLAGVLGGGGLLGLIIVWTMVAAILRTLGQ